MDYDETPGSPPLPPPDSEVGDRLPHEQLNEEDMGYLDLNPDLEEDDEVLSKPVKPATLPAGGFVIEEVPPEEIIDDDDDDDEPEQQGRPTTSSTVYDESNDFAPTFTPSHSHVGTPVSTTIHHRRLSNSQQSKFINYVDDQLLQIRRKFVQSHGLNDINGYKSLEDLIADLKKLLDFIWLSVEPRNSPMLTKEAYAQHPSPLFGQVDYLITMANDILDYCSRLEITTDSAVPLLKLLDSLDAKFARLLDGNIPGGVPMSRTEAVRLTAIAERSRVAITDLFEKKEVDGFHYELSKLYERTLDRTT